MGPKRNPEKDQTTQDMEATEDNELRERIEELKRKLVIAEKENSSLAEKVRTSEQEAVLGRDELVRSYQDRINDISVDRDRQLQDLQRDRDNLRRTLDSRENEPSSGSSQQRRSLNNHGNHEIPMPRQILFDGKLSWESFIRPFEALASANNWSDQDKLFRLTNSLRGSAAEHAFGQLPEETLGSYEDLRKALETRFKEKRSSSSYLNELENRKFTQKEKIAEFVSDIKRLVIKGFPTADQLTRDTINVRYFLKGLTDSQSALFIGMKEPRDIDEAREMLETFLSLRDEVKGQRVRAVDVKEKPEFVTEERLQEFGRDMKTSIGKKIDHLATLIGKSDNSARDQRQRKPVECYKCHQEGHYARDCPQLDNRNGASKRRGQTGN